MRHNAVLIMSLLRLMKDTGIEALMVNADAKLQVSSAVLITGQSMAPVKYRNTLPFSTFVLRLVILLPSLYSLSSFV